ncbi:hypothetical protein FJ693_04045, partial [Georgenia yuyongxinii]
MPGLSSSTQTYRSGLSTSGEEATMAAHSPLPEPEPGSVALLALEDRVRLVLAGELDLATKADL